MLRVIEIDILLAALIGRDDEFELAFGLVLGGVPSHVQHRVLAPCQRLTFGIIMLRATLIRINR